MTFAGRYARMTEFQTSVRISVVLAFANVIREAATVARYTTGGGKFAPIGANLVSEVWVRFDWDRLK